ncbi:MAG: hypothetical protein JNJ54_27190 [Myxococcaceae bacterium]|nr:hypothetical protein [Myxococcaceae bacterium]
MRSLLLLLLTLLPGCGRPDAPAAPVGGVTADAGLVVVDAGADAGQGDAGVAADAGAPAMQPDAGPGFVTRGEPSPACPDADARIVSFSIPPRIEARMAVEVSVTTQNTGARPWSRRAEHRLGSPSNADPFAANSRVELERAEVPPGATHTWTFDLRAPEDAGVYETEWQLVQEHVCWFGDRLRVPIVVDAARATGQCLAPAPPRLDQMAAVVHIRGPTRITLDSTPKVCDRTYCSRIGFTDGRSCCPPRPEGHPDVEPCNEAIVGRARDTGRVGPTWTFNGERCGPQGPGNCDNHPTNQFLLFVYGPGRARACGNLNGVCGEVEVTP